VKSLYVTVVLLLVTVGGPLPAQTNAGGQILFLHLKVKDQIITLLDSAAVPGTLKPPRELNEGLEYRLVSSTGEFLWKGGIDDPRVRRVEYDDPAQPGKLQVKFIRSDEAEFTVRVPVVSSAERVEFDVIEPAVSGTNGSPSTIRKKLGSVLLPPK